MMRDNKWLEKFLRNFSLAETKKSLRCALGSVLLRKHTLEEVGRQLNLTRERVRQIEAKVLKRLDHPKYKKRFEELFTT